MKINEIKPMYIQQIPYILEEGILYKKQNRMAINTGGWKYKNMILIFKFGCQK